MKKIILLLAIITIGLTSCNGKYTIAKRKYNKGYYVNRTNSKHTKTESIAKNTTIDKNLNETVAVEKITSSPNQNQSSPEVASTNIISKTIIEERHASTKKNEVFDSNPVKSTASSNHNLAISKKAFKEINVAKKASKFEKKGSSDSNLIVQIILALFPILCLIAVYLHDGKDITLNFWITLLLHLTLYGCCIFAVLVVLDIIDLK